MNKSVDIRIEGGNTVKVDTEGMAVFGNLMAELLRNRYIVHEDYVFCTDSDGGTTSFALEDPLDLLPESMELFARLVDFEVIVKEKDIAHRVRVSRHTQVSALKDIFHRDTGSTLTHLSFQGVRVLDSDVMAEKGIQEGSELVGIMSLTIMDSLCDLKSVVDVFDFQTISEIRQVYADTARRHPSAQSTFSLAGRLLEDEITLWQSKIPHGSELEFMNPSFGVVVQDKLDEMVNEVHLSISDHELVSQVKEKFSKETRQALERKDTLIFQGTALDDDSMVFQSGLVSGSILELQREDSSLSFLYECGDCGTDVKLKRSEPIRCRICGCRVVYKKRTFRPCQYFAR